MFFKKTKWYINMSLKLIRRICCTKCGCSMCTPDTRTAEMHTPEMRTPEMRTEYQVFVVF